MLDIKRIRTDFWCCRWKLATRGVDAAILWDEEIDAKRREYLWSRLNAWGQNVTQFRWDCPPSKENADDKIAAMQTPIRWSQPLMLNWAEIDIN